MIFSANKLSFLFLRMKIYCNFMCWNHLSNLTLWSESRTSTFSIFWSAKNYATSNVHRIISTEYFSSGKSSETFLNIKVSNSQKSQHLLTKGQHFFHIGHNTWAKLCFFRSFSLFYLAISWYLVLGPSLCLKNSLMGLKKVPKKYH